MLRGAVIVAVFVAALAAIAHRVFQQSVAGALSFPQDNFFGKIALTTMEKFNKPGMYDALSRFELKVRLCGIQEVSVHPMSSQLAWLRS